jgi:hypothetical protein
MTKKSKGSKRSTPFCPHIDLFGEIPVSMFECFLWVHVITQGRFTSSDRSFYYYLEHWNVPDKVRSAKRTGYFPLVESAYYASLAAFSPTGDASVPSGEQKSRLWGGFLHSAAN